MPFVKIADKELLLPRQVEGSPAPWKLRKWSYLRTLRSGFVFSAYPPVNWSTWPKLLQKAIDFVRNEGPVPLDELQGYMGGMFQLDHTRTISLMAKYHIEDYLTFREFFFEDMRIVSVRLESSPTLSRSMMAEIDIPDSTRVFDIASYASSMSFHVEPPWYHDFVSWFVDRTGGEILKLTDPYNFEWIKMQSWSEVESLLCSFAADAGYGAKLRNLDDEVVMEILDPSIATVVSISEHCDKLLDHQDIVKTKVGGLRTISHGDAIADYGVPIDVMVDSHLAQSIWFADSAAWAKVDSLLPTLRQQLQMILKLNGEMRQSERTPMQDMEMNYLVLVAAKAAYVTMGGILLSLGMIDGNRVRTIGERLPLPGKAVEGLIRPAGYEGWPDHLLELALALDNPDRAESGRRIFTLQNSIRKEVESIQKSALERNSYSVPNDIMNMRDSLSQTIYEMGGATMYSMLIEIPRVLDA